MPTKQEVLNDMLNEVSQTYDKREGSFIYDALAPAAKQFAKTDENIKVVEEKLSIDKLSGAELRQRVRERTGIIAREATRAIGKVQLTGTGTIQTGDLFETQSGTQFRATETKAITTSGLVSIEAVVAGPGGVVPASTIILFPITLAGFTAVTNPEPTYDGFEAESDADLLQRYYERVRTPATSGNKAHYINWAKEVPGVGDAKVFPLWAGNNTVKVTIINANKEPASTELIETVQEHVDPGGLGLGEGQAPIGAYCTTVSANAKVIDVNFAAMLEPGYTIEQVQPLAEASLTNYLRSIAFKAEIVSYALIGANIINTEGILDYTELLVNGGTANILLDIEETPVLGTVIINGS